MTYPSFDDAIARARSWRDAAAQNPASIGTVYPSTAPISYQDLDVLIAVIEGTQPIGIQFPEREYLTGNAQANSASMKD